VGVGPGTYNTSATVNVNERVTGWPPATDAVTVTVNVPAAVGVPENTRVPVLNVTPAGKPETE
jgi:hypothetical protein